MIFSKDEWKKWQGHVWSFSYFREKSAALALIETATPGNDVISNGVHAENEENI